MMYFDVRFFSFKCWKILGDLFLPVLLTLYFFLFPWKSYYRDTETDSTTYRLRLATSSPASLTCSSAISSLFLPLRLSAGYFPSPVIFSCEHLQIVFLHSCLIPLPVTNILFFEILLRYILCLFILNSYFGLKILLYLA